MKKSTLLSIILFPIITSSVFSQNNEQKFSGWKKTQTEHFTFIYEEAQKEATKGYIKIADNAWNQIGKIYAFPQDKTNVYITGRTNTVNAFTYFSPTEIVMFTNPCTLTEFTFRDNWQKLFFTHELIHVANIRFEDKSKLMQTMFGSSITTLDYSFVNGWAKEGLTTVLETELTKGGRGRSPYFELNYKSLTLDNGFIPYENIGLEKEPPRGQSYVMGYLIMRSIADRYGIQALADIERNRPFLGTFEDSVQLVTGQTPQDIYRDVRIALAKKYADERKIPEGIIISPRELNTNYYTPAIINDDGSLIALRTASQESNAVVRLDPSAKYGRNYIEDTKPQKDMNTLFKETILFSGNFMDTDAITADENGVIYAALGITSNDRAPGLSLESSIHVWTQDKGLKRLTKNISLFQPSVSRDGSTLIAVEQHGMDMRLVKVDTKTGDITVLLEKSGFSFIQPAVNADGSKVAFLELDDSRARVAVLETSKPSEYQIVANDDETIYDPTEPIWNSDGKLLFCCNYRGRLEMFEVSADNAPKPVVSDPIGATWAYKNSKGIYYTSLASSGYVIKMKPENEWGKVPEFDGPTPAGQIIHFGDLENDYPDFKPYTVLSEVEDNSEDTNQSFSSLFAKPSDEPVPVKGKKVKHRSEENIKKAEEAHSTITEIQNEKSFIPRLNSVLYFPFVNNIHFNNENYFGFGMFAALVGSRMQYKNTIGITYLVYYPKINNFDANFSIVSYPLGHTSLDIFLNRKLFNNNNLFKESNSITLGYTLPIISRQQGKNDIYLCGLTYMSAELFRTSNEALSIISNSDNQYGGYAGVGFEFSLSQSLSRNCAQSFDLVVMGTTYCPLFNNSNPDFKFGFESELSYTLDKRLIKYQLALNSRYTPYPANICPPNSSVTYGGKPLDSSMPVRLVPSLSFTLPNIILNSLDTKAYCEMLISANPAEQPSFTWDRSIMTGLEIGKYDNHMEFACGTSLRFDYDKDISMDSWNFYLRVKIYWLR